MTWLSPNGKKSTGGVGRLDPWEWGERKGKKEYEKKKILKENSMCFSSDKQKLKQNIQFALGC